MKGRRLEKQLAARLEADLGARYVVERMLGRGGMAEVWAGFDRRMERHVAIKVLDAELSGDAEFRERFRRECKTLAKFSHSRIVRVYETGELASDERLYMVMERLSGRTLRRILDEHRAAGRALDAVTAAFYAVQMLDALGAAHEQGIIHRDVKPENMMIDDQDRLTLVDLGVAKAAEVTGPVRDGARAEARRPGVQTRRSTLLGTPRYMAPELIAHKQCDARSDLYAVGIVLVEMLACEYPQTSSRRAPARARRGPSRRARCACGLWPRRARR